MTRAVSTVLDVSLFLLLLSASALLIVGASPPLGTPDAAPTASVLATSTATANYSVAGENRTAHDTLAGLLATAAVDDSGIRNGSTSSKGTFERVVVRTVAEALPRPTRTQVIARWRPYPGSEFEDRLVVGRPPPRDASVGAATMTVPSGLPPVDGEARRAARFDGFAGLARVVARHIVAGRFPPRATGTALRSEGTGEVVEREYRWTATRLNVRIVRRDGWIAVDATNDRLVTALSRRVESDLRNRYGTPKEATEGIAVGRVRITVRTWSA